MTLMQTNGYNLPKLWLDGWCPNNTIGNPAGGLSSAYLANLVDFLQRAKNHGIYVILTIDWVPQVGGYVDDFSGCNDFNDYNTLNLCAGGVRANTSFFHDLLQDLIGQQAPLDAIFAYELSNEYYYNGDLPPLSWTSGTVTTADGQTYDMSSQTSRQQMMDNGLIYFTNQGRAAIVALDPTAPVTVGFFVLQGLNPTRIGDPRLIQVYPMIGLTYDCGLCRPPCICVGGWIDTRAVCPELWFYSSATAEAARGHGGIWRAPIGLSGGEHRCRNRARLASPVLPIRLQGLELVHLGHDRCRI